MAIDLAQQVRQNRAEIAAGAMPGARVLGREPSNMSETPIRLPDAATVKAVLASLDPATADLDLAPALSAAFPGFAFLTAVVDDFYWRDARTALAADGARLGDHREWVVRELGAHGGDLNAFWYGHRDSGICFAEWRGTAAFAFAPTGPGVADFVQLSLGREIEVLAGPVVDPRYRPGSADDLLEPSWVKREPATDAVALAGPVFRLQRRSGLVHMRSFLATRQRLEREERESRRLKLETRAIREVGLDYVKETPFIELNPDWFDFVPREVRMFQDWERSSASAQPIFAHWAFDIKDHEDEGRRKLSFIPRPHKPPAERLLIEKVSPFID